MCHSYSKGVPEAICFVHVYECVCVQLLNSWIHHTHMIMKELLFTDVSGILRSGLGTESGSEREDLSSCYSASVKFIKIF